MINLIQRSTIHGVNHIYSASSKITKCLWVLLLLFGIVVVSLNIAYVTRKYLSNPVIISYTLDYEPFIWPDLTFCNPTSPYHLKKNSSGSAHWNYVFNQSREIARMLWSETKLFQIIKSKKQTDFEVEERTITMASIDPQKLRTPWFGKEFLHVSYTQTHVGIYFNKEYKGNSPVKMPVDEKSMFSTQIVQIGNNIPCHTFHVDRSKDVNQSSIQSLKFIFKFDFESNIIFNSSYVYRSIFLYINNKDELPSGKELILTPGFSNNLVLQQNRYEYSGIRRKCRQALFKVFLYDALLQSTYEYEGDYENCKEIVSQQVFVENCDCYSPFLPIYKIDGIPPLLCLNATHFNKSEILKNANCMVQVYNIYRDKSLFDVRLNKQCDIYKNIKCNSISYRIDERKEMFSEVWSNSANDRRYALLENFYKAYYDVDKENVSDEFMNKIRDTYITLKIDRESESGDLYKEQTEYPFSELLSDIGGLMGLWLGMSVIGLFEIVEFLTLLFCSTWCAKDDKSKRNDNKNEEQELVNSTET